MDKHICKAKRIDNGKWIEGYFVGSTSDVGYISRQIKNLAGWHTYEVDPKTVCRYTEMTEFVVADKSFNKPLFEGDIVEVHSVRCPYAAYPQSQYDGPVKARAVIYFKRGMWRLDYDNAYNRKLCELRGNEQQERSVNNAWELYYFGYHGGNEEWHREHNKRCHYHDIIKIGNIHDNTELMEG
jgi:hypothetical protein